MSLAVGRLSVRAEHRVLGEPAGGTVWECHKNHSSEGGRVRVRVKKSFSPGDVVLHIGDLPAALDCHQQQEPHERVGAFHIFQLLEERD